MADDADNRVAVYIDFDNIVISRYNQLHGRGAFQSDRVRQLILTDPAADPEVVERVREATVDIGAILDYASSFGQIVISCAYADWSQPVNAGYRRQLIDRAVDLTQMFALSATKNGADIRLAIDVVEDMFRLSDVTHVVLVAGDSDYVALAQRVKRLGRYIVAVGVAGATSKSLPAACNDFSLYDDLPGMGAEESDSEPADVQPQVTPPPKATKSTTTGDKKTVATTKTEPKRTSKPPQPVEAPGRAEESGGGSEPAAKMSPRAATRLLRRALELGHDKTGHDEWLHTSEVKLQIKRMDPSFHEKSLGYSSFTDFVKSRAGFAEFDKSSNGQKVRLRPATA
ncbi:MAG: NYN domain-containing protein [Micropruina sp.]|nr:NYN domain-containing protein [Micropruina sp.]